MTSTRKQRLRRYIIYVCLFAFGVALSAIFIDVEPARNLGQSAYRKWQAFVWDGWNRGSIGWGDYVVHVPAGEYGWIIHENSDLTIFSRKSQGIVSLVLKKSERAKWPYYEHSQHLCVTRKQCSEFETRSTTIGGQEVQIVRFHDTTPNIDVRLNAYIYIPSPEILVLVGAEYPAEFDAGVNVGQTLLEQIASQANSRYRRDGTQPK